MDGLSAKQEQNQLTNRQNNTQKNRKKKAKSMQCQITLLFLVHYSAVIRKKLCYWCYSEIERFSNECRKTKTKIITPANHNKHKLPNEPIRTRSKYM